MNTTWLHRDETCHLRLHKLGKSHSFLKWNTYSIAFVSTLLFQGACTFLIVRGMANNFKRVPGKVSPIVGVFVVEVCIDSRYRNCWVRRLSLSLVRVIIFYSTITGWKTLTFFIFSLNPFVYFDCSCHCSSVTPTLIVSFAHVVHLW